MENTSYCEKQIDGNFMGKKRVPVKLEDVAHRAGYTSASTHLAEQRAGEVEDVQKSGVGEVPQPRNTRQS